MTSEARCRKCFQRLEPGAKFCGRCGTELQAADPAISGSRVQSSAGIECPSCHEINAPTARFCESCGTQLQAGFARDQPQTAAPGPTSAGAAASEDPWATGPGYERPLRVDQRCPRCGEFRSPTDSVCGSCGLPFAPSVNAAGIPAAVAAQGTPAGFWIRFAAVIIDGIIINIANAIIGGFLGFNTLTGGGLEQYSEGTQALIQLMLFALNTAYAVAFLVARGATPGKMLFNIYILDENGRRGLSVGRALARELSKYISALILLIGYIMAAFREDKRALHDLIAGTYPTTLRRNR